MRTFNIWFVFICGFSGLTLGIYQLIHAINNDGSITMPIINIILWSIYILSIYYSIKTKKHP